MNKLFHTSKVLFATLLLAMIMMTTSCSSEGDVYAKVPEDARFVMSIKAKGLAEKSNAVKKVREIANLVGEQEAKDAADMLETLFGDDSPVDLNNIVMFEYEGSVYAWLMVNDVEMLDKIDAYERGQLVFGEKRVPISDANKETLQKYFSERTIQSKGA